MSAQGATDEPFQKLAEKIYIFRNIQEKIKAQESDRSKTLKKCYASIMLTKDP